MLLAFVIQRFNSQIHRAGSEFFFDAEKLVVLGDAIGAADGAGLDLAYAGGDCKIGDEGVFALAGTVRHDRGVTVPTAEFNRLERLGQGADLVHLDENRIGNTLLNTLAEEIDIGDEEIVTDELNFVPQARGQFFPTGPIVLRASIFD